jgi:uncharacterized membrane protein YgcG
VEIRDITAGGRLISTRRDGEELVVRIGDPDKWANAAERYTLSYVYDIGDDGLEDMDELYCNILADYDTTTDKMTFTIEMPHPFDANRLNFTHGPKGSKDNTYVEWSVSGTVSDGTVITGRLTRVNQPHEQLTVALPLPKGYYTAAAGRTHGNASLAYSWLALPAVGVSLLFWYFLGRERKFFPTVEFYPPPGINPADAGYVMNKKVSKMDVISFIIYWADKGYLHISDAVSGFSLRKLREMDPEAKPYEKKLFDAMFGRASDGQVTTSTLADGEFYSDLENARKNLVSFHNEDPGTRIFKKGAYKLLIGAPLLICLFIIIFTALGGAMEIESVLAALAVAGVCLFCLMLLGILLSFSINCIRRRKYVLSIMAAVMPIALFGIMGQAAALIIPCALIYGSRRRTDVGLKYLERLTGFKTFLETAERDRIDMLANKDPQYFYNVLPYALTLGVTDTWAKKFRHVGLRPPEWYDSSETESSFSSLSFASNLSDGLSRFEKAVDASRRSDSDSGDSSGGGSSGGGSGGGSGTSW